MTEIFFKMQADNVFGWEFDGQQPSDEFILRMAKIGVIVEYVSDADNDYQGALLYLTQVGKNGKNKLFTYCKRDNDHSSNTVVMWTEGSMGEGRIIDEWDYDQKIRWSRVDE